MIPLWTAGLRLHTESLPQTQQRASQSLWAAYSSTKLVPHRSFYKGSWMCIYRLLKLHLTRSVSSTDTGNLTTTAHGCSAYTTSSIWLFLPHWEMVSVSQIGLIVNVSYLKQEFSIGLYICRESWDQFSRLLLRSVDMISKVGSWCYFSQLTQPSVWSCQCCCSLLHLHRVTVLFVWWKWSLSYAVCHIWGSFMWPCLSYGNFWLYKQVTCCHCVYSS